ncbi:hypothetical protein Hdeb2414_s0093g00789351 [Helianthus debilis subsp. tardiflorus]
MQCVVLVYRELHTDRSIPPRDRDFCESILSETHTHIESLQVRFVNIVLVI